MGLIGNGVCAHSIRDGERISHFSRRDAGSLPAGFGGETVELFYSWEKPLLWAGLKWKKKTKGFVSPQKLS